jgi:hypothetical protein
MSNASGVDAGTVAEVIFGPVVLSALNPLIAFLGWLKANPNADKLTAAAQFNAFLAQEQVALLQGGSAGAGNLAALANAVALKLQADLSAKLNAATGSILTTAAAGG